MQKEKRTFEHSIESAHWLNARRQYHLEEHYTSWYLWGVFKREWKSGRLWRSATGLLGLVGAIYMLLFI